MPELQIDVAVANRFISSLSKSLQALCHGCMDFDSGIEIVGYININIDSGSKVDYVLNEKVLKSTTNSMTFVSNSFLAKKEQQKQTRDGACSPIQQQTALSYSSQMRGAHYGSPYERTASQFSSHAHFQRGSQKRTKPDSWRSSPKKHPFKESEYSFNSQAIQQSHSQMMSVSSTSSYTDSNFKQPQEPTNSDSNAGDPTLQLQINIKKEALESDNQNDPNADNSDHLLDDQNLSSSVGQVDRPQVKSDPDEASSYSDKSAPTDSSGAVASEDTDLKDNFLEPSSSEHPQESSEESIYPPDNHLPTFGLVSESAATKDQALTDEMNIPGTSALNPADSEAGISAENESDIPVEYDEGGEDESCPQSAYDDAGEGSSDAGQFEVIEIDDEDEDVQAMFGDHRANSARQKKQYLSLSQSGRRDRAGEKRAGRVTKSRSVPLPTTGQPCRHCPAVFGDHFALAAHTSECHKIEMPFRCSICGKGYLSMTGLNLHMEAHTGKSYMCPICDSKFTQKGTIKMHLRGIHHMAQCSTCSAVFRLGPEYNQHVLHCHS